jgi:hypothetical protein
MTYTRLIGDIHGRFNDYRNYSIGNFDGPTIQVGDFGLGFGQSPYWYTSVDAHQNDGTHRFIRGNHDDPVMCTTMRGFIPDGTIEGHTMFLGGAWSIDNPAAPPGWRRRTAGVDWWEDEECTALQFDMFLDIYATMQPRVMITHDCPIIAAKRMFFDSGFITGPQYSNRTASALQRMYEVHQPDIHIFGHYHKTMLHIEGKTYFMCIGELDYIDINLEDIEQAQQAMVDKVNSK